MFLPLSKRFRRSKNVWLFGHSNRIFAGNSRFLFLWMSIHRPDIRVIWIAHDEKTRRLLEQSGFEAYRRWSYRGILSALRAGVFVYCHGLSDVSPHFSSGALLVNLWHGVGVKATMFGETAGPMYRFMRKYGRNPLTRFFHYELLKAPDVLAVTSDFTQRHFAEQFLLPESSCPQLGYPRLDIAVDPQLKSLSARIDEQHGFKFNADGFAKVLVYVPTWRDSGRPFISEALPDMARLSAALARSDSLLYVKIHPWTLETFASDFPNIRLWPSEVEIFTYLQDVDAMITDYSSLLYDYIFIKSAGVALYMFDSAEYQAKDRVLAHSFDENTVGLRISSFEELCDAIATEKIFEVFADERGVRQKFWGELQAPSSPRVIEHLETLLDAR